MKYDSSYGLKTEEEKKTSSIKNRLPIAERFGCHIGLQLLALPRSVEQHTHLEIRVLIGCHSRWLWEPMGFLSYGAGTFSANWNRKVEDWHGTSWILQEGKWRLLKFKFTPIVPFFSVQSQAVTTIQRSRLNDPKEDNHVRETALQSWSVWIYIYLYSLSYTRASSPSLIVDYRVASRLMLSRSIDFSLQLAS